MWVSRTLGGECDTHLDRRIPVPSPLGPEAGCGPHRLDWIDDLASCKKKMLRRGSSSQVRELGRVWEQADTLQTSACDHGPEKGGRESGRIIASFRP